MSENACIMEELFKNIKQLSNLVRSCQWDKLRDSILDLSRNSDFSSINKKMVGIEDTDDCINIEISSIGMLRLFLRVVQLDLCESVVCFDNKCNHISILNWTDKSLILSIKKDDVCGEDMVNFIAAVALFYFTTRDSFSFPSNGFSSIKEIGTKNLEFEMVIKRHCRYSLNKVFNSIQNDNVLGSECIMSYIPNSKIVISGNSMELLLTWVILYEQCERIDSDAFFIR